MEALRADRRGHAAFASSEISATLSKVAPALTCVAPPRPLPPPPRPRLQHTTERYITLVIAKKPPHEHWPRLLKAAGKPAPNIKVGGGAADCAVRAGCM